MSYTVSEEEIKKHLKLSIPVYVFEEIGSTNTFAKGLKDNCALVVADSQTNGKGRMGRAFYSPKGTGIYLSLVAPVADLYTSVPFITTAASVAVHRAISDLGIKTEIKWVNDIYLNNKKLAGILCETADSSRVVIGIGINFAPSPMPDELKSSVAFLFESEPRVTKSELIALVTNNLLTLLADLKNTDFITYYKAHSCVLGKKVLCIQASSAFMAEAIDIDSHGGLIVRTENGTQTLRTGEVSIRFTD